jgi:hypothetical protein
MAGLFIGRSILVPYLVVAAVAVSRLVFTNPHDLIPLFSVLLFFGACRPVREFGIVLLGLIGLDTFISTHHYSLKLAPDQVLTWMWYLLAVNLGAAALRHTISIRRIIGSSLLITVSFFVARNFAIWIEWYPRTLNGLRASYAAALPLFRFSALVELLSILVLFAMARFSRTWMVGVRLKDVCP